MTFNWQQPINWKFERNENTAKTETIGIAWKAREQETSENGIT